VTGGKAVRPTADDRRTQDAIAGVLDAHDPQASARKARDMAQERLDYAREVVETAGRFPVYEVPPEVAERFPGFDPADPSTWPEPTKCTEGRPWGLDAYGSVWGNWRERWDSYLTDRTIRNRCRNRWRDPELRLCGTHVNTYRQLLADNERRLARYAREEEHRDLARRLAALGIEATGFSDSVRLSADAARHLLDVLDSVDLT
jgi:hypothetical protein